MDSTTLTTLIGIFTIFNILWIISEVCLYIQRGKYGFFDHFFYGLGGKLFRIFMIILWISIIIKPLGYLIGKLILN